MQSLLNPFVRYQLACFKFSGVRSFFENLRGLMSQIRYSDD